MDRSVKFVVLCLVLAGGKTGMAVNQMAKLPSAAEDMYLIRTFHIGNSLTDTVNGWLAPAAESAGRKIDFHRFTIPGAPTDWLWAHPGSGFGDSNYEEAFEKLAPIDHLFT
jgi:hypothetical protein